ncbi:hypothetical protein [Glutamicibacter sp. JC586]|uniref:hypothetical protein n=1 Tax=Glutamicibacter sp. JC586 TaxID=2590552 RepID=UPI00135B2129|nr:hypothetical protein [Glutamicibacter sp. JC586]
MGIFSRKKALGASAVVSLIGALAFGAAPAQASNRPIDITGYSVSDVVVSSDSCKNILVTAKAKFANDFNDAAVESYVSHNGDELWDHYGFDFVNKKQTTRNDRIEICPDRTGLGVYTIAPAYVVATFNYLDDGTPSLATRDYWDTTKKSFYVRGKTKSNLSVKRSGKKVTLTTTATVFSPEKNRYVGYNPKNATLQVKSGKTWKTIKTVKLTKGKASVTLKDSKKKTYRVTVPKASWAVATTTAPVTK